MPIGGNKTTRPLALELPVIVILITKQTTGQNNYFYIYNKLQQLYVLLRMPVYVKIVRRFSGISYSPAFLGRSYDVTLQSALAGHGLNIHASVFSLKMQTVLFETALR